MLCMPSCPACQSEVEPEAELCFSCGEPMGAAAPPVAAPASPNVPPPAESAPRVVRSAAPPNRPTMPASPGALRGAGPARSRAEEEPEPVRCPGCGVPSRAARCPGCGAVLRHDD